MKKVFLGGTCNASTWREELAQMLKLDYFNPVVEDWTEEAREEEERQKKVCDFCLFVITPRMKGVYAIAEAVQLSIQRPATTFFCVLHEDEDLKFTEEQSASLEAVKKMIRYAGASVFGSLSEVAEYLNKDSAIKYGPNMIECRIERDGPTQINLGKASYMFEKDGEGHYVCEVLSQDHRKHLLLIPGFCVYEDENVPKAEFTPAEELFISSWRILDATAYLAFVNGHTAELNDSSDKIRLLAIEKWKRQLPDMQSCPIRSVVPISAPAEASDMLPNESTAESSSVTAFERRFYDQWRLLPGNMFKKFIEKNERQFFDLPMSMWDKAKAKWEKLITNRTGEPWPYVEIAPDDR